MKKFLCSLFVLVMLFAVNISVVHGITISTDDLPISDWIIYNPITSKIPPIPLSGKCCSVLGSIFDTKCDNAFYAGDWSPALWYGQQDSTQKSLRWSPFISGIKSLGSQGVKVRLVFSPENVRFFSQSCFTGTNTRIPYAIEIDVIDSEGIFGKAGEQDFHFVNNNLPVVIEDVSAFDSEHQMSVIIARPDKLVPYKVYEITLVPNNPPSSSQIESNKNIKYNLQLVVNYKWLEFSYLTDLTFLPKITVRNVKLIK